MSTEARQVCALRRHAPSGGVPHADDFFAQRAAPAGTKESSSFDDGPIPGARTACLRHRRRRRQGRFMMVREMEPPHPALARKVAMDGNADRGSHDLQSTTTVASLTFDMAMAEVTRGEAAVTKATGAGRQLLPFSLSGRQPQAEGLPSPCATWSLLDVDIDTRTISACTPANCHQANDGPAAQARARHHPDARHPQPHRHDAADAPARRLRSRGLQGSDAEIQEGLPLPLKWRRCKSTTGACPSASF